MIKANTRISQAKLCHPGNAPGTYQTASMPIMEIWQRKKPEIHKQKNPLSILYRVHIDY
jgi:hypothetical protein